ncbi:MAG: carbohydrate kinase family protein [Erysipelotrichaceae bacterium]|nr:carbohydrate kinase family protein [Erysipelotrichaceae bacterium]
MSTVSVIGSSWIEESIIANTDITASKNTPSSIYQYFSGDMRNVAYTLAQLGCNTSFCTKYGNDDDTTKMWNELNDLDIMQYGPTIPYKLPRLVSVTSKQKTLKFYEGSEDFSFQTDDLYPHASFETSDYVITDITDNQVLELLVRKSLKTKWVITRFVPNKNILSHVEGIILKYEDALQLGKPMDFDRICYRLCELGAKWIIITMGSQGIYTYRNRMSNYFEGFPTDHGYQNGCYSGFVAGFIYGLMEYYDFPKAIHFGNQVANAINKVPESTRKDINEFIKK